MTSHWTSLTCVDMILLENICECCPMTCHAQLNDLCPCNMDFCDGLSKPRWNIPRHSILKDGNEYWDCRAQVSEMWWVKGHKSLGARCFGTPLGGVHFEKVVFVSSEFSVSSLTPTVRDWCLHLPLLQMKPWQIKPAVWIHDLTAWNICVSSKDMLRARFAKKNKYSIRGLNNMTYTDTLT